MKILSYCQYLVLVTTQQVEVEIFLLSFIGKLGYLSNFLNYQLSQYFVRNFIVCNRAISISGEVSSNFDWVLIEFWLDSDITGNITHHHILVATYTP